MTKTKKEKKIDLKDYPLNSDLVEAGFKNILGETKDREDSEDEGK